MVKLRLTRTGKKHEPHYRLIAISARTKRDGEAIEFLGHYNPRTNPSTVEFKTERVKYWLSVGAQPTKTVHGLLVKQGIVKPETKTKSTSKAKTEAKQKKESTK